MTDPQHEDRVVPAREQPTHEHPVHKEPASQESSTPEQPVPEQQSSEQLTPEQLTLPGMPAAPPRTRPGKQSQSAKKPGRAKGRGSGPALGAAGLTPATHLPVARVSIDVAPLHLDRPFDYLVTEQMSEGAQPGTRVKVRFGAQDVDGYILERIQESDHKGRLSPIRRLVSPEIVMSPSVAKLARAVADHYGGSLSDVLRLAIPPRHARIEGAAPPVISSPPVMSSPPVISSPPVVSSASHESQLGGAAKEPGSAPGEDIGASRSRPGHSAWSTYTGGEAFIRRMQAGNAPRAVWTSLPGSWRREPEEHEGIVAGGGEGAPAADGLAEAVPSGGLEKAVAAGGWEEAIAEAIHAAFITGWGVLVILPDLRDVDRLTLALSAIGLTPYGTRGGDFARLLADDGAAQRYRSYLAVLRGDVRIAIGTRAAAFAPVHNLGLVVCWEDIERTHQEPRAPYPHVREVLGLRSELEECAFLVGSVVRSAQAQALLASGWAREIVAQRPEVRTRTPRVRIMDSTELASEGAAAAARIPNPAWRLLRDALGHGPVLIQVPRRGYVPVIACQRCREPTRCSKCHGPLGLMRSGSEPQCTWCGQLAGDWHCSECGGNQVRSVRVGSQRTAEELGRAFPGFTIKVSGAGTEGGVLAEVTSAPAIVVATPGAEPVAHGGYSAALLLDAAVTSAGTGLDSGHHALHRWVSAASLVRSGGEGGAVALVGDAAPAVANALVRWDPVGYADRDLTERAELGLPPAVRVGAVTGDRQGLSAILNHLVLGEGWQVLGPIEMPSPDDATQGSFAGHPSESLSRAIVTAPRHDGRALALALRSAAATRSLKREGSEGRIQLDPEELL